MTALEHLQHHYRQREQTAREWQESGSKVAGHIGGGCARGVAHRCQVFPSTDYGRPGGQHSAGLYPN